MLNVYDEQTGLPVLPWSEQVADEDKKEETQEDSAALLKKYAPIAFPGFPNGAPREAQER